MTYNNFKHSHVRPGNTRLISKVFKGHLQAYSTTTVNIYINSIDSIESSTMDYKGKAMLLFCSQYK